MASSGAQAAGIYSMPATGTEAQGKCWQITAFPQASVFPSMYWREPFPLAFWRLWVLTSLMIVTPPGSQQHFPQAAPLPRLGRHSRSGCRRLGTSGASAHPSLDGKGKGHSFCPVLCAPYKGLTVQVSIGGSVWRQ